MPSQAFLIAVTKFTTQTSYSLYRLLTELTYTSLTFFDIW